MGDEGMKGNGSSRWRSASLAVAFGLLLLAGCATSPGPQTVAAAPVVAPAPAVAELGTIAVREVAPGTRVELTASEALVWTSYRDEAGRLVVELPNTRPAPGVGEWSAPEGLLARLGVELDESGDRPLTRLLVETRGETEHALVGDGGRLQLDLLPAGDAEVAAVEPLPAETVLAAQVPAPEPPAPAVAETAAPTAPARPAAFGTPEAPLAGPPPAGPLATRLAAVEVVPDPAASLVRIVGDGEFAFSTFRLSGPDRLVIDLAGVFNGSRQSALPVGDPLVERVRVSQFRTAPEPVSRVVVDLRADVSASIERAAGGLLVRMVPAGTAPPRTLVEDLRAPVAAASEPLPPVVAAPALPAVAPDVVADAEPAIPAPAPEPEVAALPAPTLPEPVAPAPVAPVAVAAAEPPPVPQQLLQPVELFEAADPTAGAEDPFPTRTEVAPSAFQAQTIGGQRKQYVGEPISLELKDGDILDVLRSFAKISGLNVVVQPGVRGTVTVQLENVPWDQALDQILKINGLGYELDGNIMRIAPVRVLREEAAEQARLAIEQQKAIPLRTVLKRLSYASVTDVSRILRGGSGLMSQRGTIQVDNRTNTLIIKELPSFMDTVLAVIESLDIPEPQVMIEARIIETTKNFSRSLGVEWGFEGVADAAHGNTTGLVFPNSVEGGGGVNLQTGGRNGFLDLTLGNVLNTFRLNASLNAAESEGLINVLSAPRIATLNNETAEIQSGLQIPIQTVANNTVSVQFVNATLRLEVTPHVTAEGTVMLEIRVQKREPQLAFAVVGAQNAPIATKEARTRVIVRDGGTTVIGGIYQVTTDQGQDRVPALADIPLLGHLFKNKRRSDKNEELLIFITPRVVRL